MTAAILFAFASATFLGAAVVTSQLGLRTIEPLSGAAISVPAFTLLFLLLFISCTYTIKIKDGPTAYDRKQYALAAPMLERELRKALDRVAVQVPRP